MPGSTTETPGFTNFSQGFVIFDFNLKTSVNKLFFGDELNVARSSSSPALFGTA